MSLMIINNGGAGSGGGVTRITPTNWDEVKAAVATMNVGDILIGESINNSPGGTSTPTREFTNLFLIKSSNYGSSGANFIGSGLVTMGFTAGAKTYAELTKAVILTGTYMTMTVYFKGNSNFQLQTQDMIDYFRLTNWTILKFN